MAGVQRPPYRRGLIIHVDQLCRLVRDAVLTVAAPLVAGRVLVLTGNAASSHTMADFFAQAGAEAVYRLVLPLTTGQLAHRFAAVESLMADPPEAVTREIDALDPTGRGLVYAGSFTAVPTFCGRPVLGARSRRHFNAERKDVQHHLLHDASRRRLLDLGSITNARLAITAQASRGPVVVQGIPRSLLAMGTSHTYAVPTSPPSDRVAQLLATVARDCAAILLAPLDSGIPCTFYGFVTPEWVADFGPFEALVYWDNRTWRIQAPGIARPLLLGDRAEAECRSAVHGTARQLHRQTGYVGAFGTDGVVTNTQCVIHEINPRVCAGFALLDQMCQHPVPLGAVDLALRKQPVSASYALDGPIGRLATPLRAMQSPLIRLWDAEHREVQDHLSAVAQTMSDPAVWLRLARRSLANEHLVPITELDPAGAEACG